MHSTGDTERLGELTRLPAPNGMLPWFSGFVHRHDTLGGEVVHELPEARPSIQVMLGDTYWLLERSAPSDWRKTPRIGLWGPRTRWGYGYARRTIRVFAIALHPIALKPLLGVDPPKVANRVLDIGEINPDLARALEPNDETFPDWSQRLGRLLAARLPEPGREITTLLQSAERIMSADTRTIEDAAQGAGWSGRQFLRKFEEAFGMSPKLYQRIARLDRLLRQLHPSPWEHDPYPDAPLEFSDQAHLTREVRRLTGLTPAAYARAKAEERDTVLRSVGAIYGSDPPPPPPIEDAEAAPQP
jgi:AraC-like DNA-binding protein